MVSYVTAPDKSEPLGGTAPAANDFLRRCAQLRELRPDCQKPVLHFSLSQPPGERLTDEQWHQAATQFRTEMGLQDHDFLMVRHTDTEHDHVHMVVSKIAPDGRLWNTQNSAKRAMAVCEKIENSLGLTKTKTLDEFREETGHRRRVVRDGATNEFRRTGKVKSQVQLAIQNRKAREKSNEQNRATHPGTGAARDQQREKNLGALRGDEKGNHRAQKPSGRIRSIQNRAGEVLFRLGQEVVARQDAQGQHIELFTLNQEAIDLAIRQAQRSGQIPLEIYGTPEFIEAARARAEILRVPVAPTTKGAVNEYRDNQSDIAGARREPPPPTGGRLRNLSAVPLVHHQRPSEVLLPTDVRGHLVNGRTASGHSVRRPKEGEQEMIALRRDEFRGDFEIKDDQGKCRGFIWQYQKNWVCRVDDLPSRNFESYNEAVVEAKKLVESADRNARLESLAQAIRTGQRWEKAAAVLEWVRAEKRKGMPPAESIALARAHGQIDPTLIDNAARAENVPLPEVPDDDFEIHDQEHSQPQPQHQMKG